MCATYNGSSVTRCLWLDANVTIALVFGALLSEQMSECAPLCTAAFLHMYPPNRVDVIACDHPHPSHPTPDSAAADWWSSSPKGLTPAWRRAFMSHHQNTPNSAFSFPSSFPFLSLSPCLVFWLQLTFSHPQQKELSHIMSHNHWNNSKMSCKYYRLTNKLWMKCISVAVLVYSCWRLDWPHYLISGSFV